MWGCSQTTAKRYPGGRGAPVPPPTGLCCPSSFLQILLPVFFLLQFSSCNSFLFRSLLEKSKGDELEEGESWQVILVELIGNGSQSTPLTSVGHPLRGRGSLYGLHVHGRATFITH